MKPLHIAVVTPLPVSGLEGGNERHFRSLTEALNELGHDAELVGTISPEADLQEVLSSYRMFHDLDLDWADVVVSGKYPSFMVRHPRHVRHLNHTLRGLYEHYPPHLPTEIDGRLATELDELGDDVDAIIDWALQVCRADTSDPAFAFPGPFARIVVHRLDRIGRDRLAAEATVSEVVANRPGYVDPSRSISIIPPLGDLEPPAPVGASPDDVDLATDHPFLFTFGRLDGAKRVDLIMKAFDLARRTPGMGDVELIVAGDGPLANDLEATKPPSVQLVGRLSDRALTAHLQRARAVVLTPIDEDYGLVAAEAMAAGAPVITVTDSGGIAEQVTHGVNGLVTPPRATPLAWAIRRLVRDPDQAARLGRSGRDTVSGLSWRPLVELIESTGSRDHRPRVLLVSTFAATSVSNGGERRLRGMAAGLAVHGFEPVILSLANTVPPDAVVRRRTPDGVHHITVGRARPHLAADFAMSTLAGLPVDDIGCGELWPASPSFRPELQAQVDRADVVIASHPFLISAIETVVDDQAVPLVYDAFNVETDFKADLLAGRDGAEWFGRRAAADEFATLELARLVSATSRPDLDRLGRLAGRAVPAVVAPNPLDPSVTTPRTNDERLQARARFLLDHGLAGDARPLVVFVGSDHPPNRAAAARAVLLANARPDLHVVIAGAVQVTAGGACTVVGPFRSDDLRRLHVMADIVINPVTEGSGTSLKLIDPLALGVPVVSTAIGARGLEDPQGVVWLAEADPASLGAAIDACLADGDERTRRAEAGGRVAADAIPERAMAELAAHMWQLLAADS